MSGIIHGDIIHGQEYGKSKNGNYLAAPKNSIYIEKYRKL